MPEKTIVIGLGPVPKNLVEGELGRSVDFVETPGPEDYAKAEGAIVRAAVKVGPAELDTMPNLKVIARTGVGVDDVDVDAATERGIPVAITPGANSTAVAEGAFAHMLQLVKSLGPLTEIVRSGGWTERTSVPVGDLDGATLGIVGFGNIGRRVKAIAEAFGMTVLAYDPVAEVPEANRSETVDEILRASDIVTLHVPLLKSTRHMIDAHAIETMKDGAILVNTSRGGLIDEDAALAGLESGKLGGVGLDSFESEPPQPHPLFQHPRTVLSPHVMGLSTKASRATFIAAARAVDAVLKGEHPDAAVNAAETQAARAAAGKGDNQ
ncbi:MULTISPECIES: NAD(P)-dependent oxidoreductase [unclassified Brevibacterium]|uniref:NAD(P)-dependent oxidoreductase n=1 Tax=unclassified Brevibacterium TaxID=2614124 RepID=UPI00109195D8|nr:NAD(P)-dependent oxidoreductase [Brevibacterium sp. S22]TGD30029.1 oxidoreductase [Brevibacterium sp. S22]